MMESAVVDPDLAGRDAGETLDGSFDLERDPATGGFALRDGELWPLARPDPAVELAQVLRGGLTRRAGSRPRAGR